MRALVPGFPHVLFALVLAAPVLASDWKAPSEPKELKREVKATVKEYDALSGNHDLIQTRRRRELIRRLGEMKHPDSEKALRRILQREADIRARINAMNSLVQVGDIRAVQAMYKYVLKQVKKNVLPAYLGRALALTTDEEVKAWIVDKPLANTDDQIRLSAIEALGELRYRGALAALKALHDKEANRSNSSGDAVIMYETLRAMGRVGGDEVRETLQRAAQSKDWRMRLAAAEVLLDHNRDDKSLELMRALSKEERQVIREEAAVSVGRNKVEPLFDTLILTMREGSLRCKWAAYESMKAISGQDYSLAPDVWAKWWSDRQRGKLTEEGKLAPGERMSVSTYYNFKIYSDRVLFVVDVSGSMMWLEVPPQRIDIAKKELLKAIRSLDEKTLFNVMTFSSDMQTWKKDGEVLATPEAIKDVVDWLETRLLPRGGTNTYGALMDSIRGNPKVDTVFFMSDGLPSSGEMEVQEEILVALRAENRFRKVRFNTIALVFGKSKIEKAWKYEDPEEMGAFMRRIAEETGGSSVVIDKPFFDLKD